MITLFILLITVSGLFRFVLDWLLKKHWGVHLGIPQVLAGALVILAGLPDILKPIQFPVPLSITIGLLLPELVLRRG